MQTNLRYLRKQAGLSQLQLQNETGIHQSLLSKYETGERVPSVEALLILADFYRVSVDFILQRTLNPYVNE